MKKLITFLCAVLWTSATIWATEGDVTYTYNFEKIFDPSSLLVDDVKFTSPVVCFTVDGDTYGYSEEKGTDAVLTFVPRVSYNEESQQYSNSKGFYNKTKKSVRSETNSTTSDIYFKITPNSTYTYASVSVYFANTGNNEGRYVVLSNAPCNPNDSESEKYFIGEKLQDDTNEKVTLSQYNISTSESIYVLCSNSMDFFEITVSFYNTKIEVQETESSHAGEATITYVEGVSKVELSEEDLIGTILSGDPTYITFSSEEDFTISYTEDSETVTVNAYANKDRTIVITENTDLGSFVLSADLDTGGSQGVTWTVYTTAYTAPKENSDSATATADGVELTLDDLIYEVPEDDVTYIIFTAETEFTVSYSDGTETVSATGISLTIEVTETVDLTSFVLTAASDTEVAWTVHTDELPEPELTGVTYEYIFDNDTMTGLAGEGGILNSLSDTKDITIYFTPESASTTEEDGDGILSWTTSTSGKTGSKVLTDNGSTDGVYKSALTTGAQTQNYQEEGLGAYFTVTCPDDYDGYYMQVRATFYSNGAEERTVAISEEAVAYSSSGTYLGSATSTGKSDMKVAAGTKQMEKGESLYVLCSANVGYYEVMVIFSEQALDSGTESGNNGDGEDGGESDAISSISIDNVVEVARYNILGQKIDGAQKGINIVKYSDGSTQKVLVK